MKSYETLVAELQEKLKEHRELLKKWEAARREISDLEYRARTIRTALNTAALDCHNLFEQLGIKPHNSVPSIKERETSNG